MNYSTSLLFYRGTTFTLGLAIFAVSLGGCFGLIWMRDQVARTAASAARMERTIKELDRENATLSAQIARAHQPAFLQAQMPRGMSPTEEARVVWVEAPRHRLPARQVPPASDDPLHRESPLVISFDLALIESRSGQPQ